MFIIHDGIHSCIHPHLGQKKIIDAIPHADNAGYKSMSNSDKAFYVSGTREAVWKRLEEWVSSDKPICFLIGAAGMGKSTIASEFCRRYETQLGASFFFKRNDGNVGSTRIFFTTLAYQLAESRAELRPHIVRAAESHRKAGISQQMQYAVEDLLHKPLDAAENAIGSHSVVYIVVDALDECTESSTQPDLIPECLQLLVSCALRHPSTFRLLLTSRPVPDHVEKARQDWELKDRSVLLSLYNIEERWAIDRDICELIRTRLCAVEEGKQWHQSDPTVVDRLTQQSQGVFVYARTAVDFVVGGTGLGEMKDRLDLLLTPHNRYGLDPLDELYRIVLETAFRTKELYPKKHEQVRLILAWVALCQDSGGISPDDVAKISGIPCAESIPILSRLRSVLVFNDASSDIYQTPFRAMHVTFRDFLVDQKRCEDHFYVDPGSMHARIATGFVTRLHRDPIDSIQYRLDYWKEHVKQAAPTEEFIGILKTIFTSLFSTRTSPFYTKYLRGVPSLYALMDRQVVDHQIIEPVIHSKLCATPNGAQCYKRDQTIVPQLVEKVEGMWVYVYTALHFICAGADTAEMEYRLQLVLAPRETYGLSDLNLLYRTVLECEFPPGDQESVTHEHVQHLLAWITLWEWTFGEITPSLIKALSGIPSRETTSILTKLRPLLSFGIPMNDADDQRFSPIHGIWNGFQWRKRHSGDTGFHVDRDRMKALLAFDCLRTLHNDLYIPGRRGDAGHYARRYWIDHVVNSTSFTEDLINMLREIFSSVSTSQPSYFFSYDALRVCGEVAKWVDKQIVSGTVYSIQDLAIEINLWMLSVTGSGTSRDHW